MDETERLLTELLEKQEQIIARCMNLATKIEKTLKGESLEQ